MSVVIQAASPDLNTVSPGADVDIADQLPDVCDGFAASDEINDDEAPVRAWPEAASLADEPKLEIRNVA